MSSKKSLQEDPQLFAEIRDLLDAGRDTAYRSVNSIMVKTYWQIGKRIVEEEQTGKARADYGEYLIVNLSRYLTDCFGKGFSVANLKNIRQFYQRFPNFDELATQCVANLGWTHLRLIKRGEGDNATLGIILCADKDETMVKYSVLKESSQLFASKYKAVLPTEKELVSFIERENREG